MKSVLPFMGSLLLTAACGVAVALLWPKFTSAPRPPVLEQVRSVVMQTPVGQSAAQVLGVADGQAPVTPLTVQSVTDTVSQAVVNTVREKTQEIVSRQIVNQIVQQFDKLDKDQKQIVQEAVCK